MDGTPNQACESQWATDLQIDALIDALEQDMPQLQLGNGNVFALAHAWADRHDAIIAVAPPELLGSVEARLSRIGIRWGVAPGARVTTQFRALDALPSASSGFWEKYKRK